MSVDERTRLAIRSWFAEQLNDDLADAIMESMPPIEWTDVATKDDLALMGRELRAETAELRAEMHLGFAAVSNEFAAVSNEFAAVSNEFAVVHKELAGIHKELAGIHKELAGIHKEFADIRNGFADMKRWTVMSGIGIATSSWAAAIAMVALN
jgi:hypothetical protein